jgi:hypothetical protein
MEEYHLIPLSSEHTIYLSVVLLHHHYPLCSHCKASVLPFLADRDADDADHDPIVSEDT